MKTSRITLASYSAISALFLSVNENAMSQVNYIDIDPDIILDSATGIAGIDLDGDGLNDFVFLNESFYTISFGDILRQEIFVDAANSPGEFDNGIIGSYWYMSEGTGEYKLDFPFALEKFSLISPAENFQFDSDQLLAMRSITSDGDTLEFMDPHWFPDVSNKYLGITFIDTSGSKHYGWIRCTTKEHGRILIIKDYAYELQPDQPILAGDIEHYTSVSDNNPPHPTIYCMNNIIYVQLSNDFIQKPLLQIINTSGEVVFKDLVDQKNSALKLNLPPGIYLVNLQGYLNCSTKIFMN